MQSLNEEPFVIVSSGQNTTPNFIKAAVSRARKTWLVQIPPGTQWRLILFCAARDLSRSVIIVKTSFETEPTDETGRQGGGCVISLDNKHNMKRHTKKHVEVWSSSERQYQQTYMMPQDEWNKQFVVKQIKDSVMLKCLLAPPSKPILFEL